jgi:hypothetical protein
VHTYSSQTTKSVEVGNGGQVAGSAANSGSVGPNGLSATGNVNQINISSNIAQCVIRNIHYNDFFKFNVHRKLQVGYRSAIANTVKSILRMP